MLLGNNADEEISFARQYRPTRFEDYVGNTKVKETLREYLKHKKVQSILLTGNTGCGKSTIARLIVKEYLCEDWSPETGACNHCFQCEAVNEYIRTGSTEMLNDVYEVDVGEKSGKKDLDFVLETVEYPAMSGGWKILIFDECHSASDAAQNRLLKVLEEPPEKVLFIFCTTDPQRMLSTLKNRCQLALHITKPTLSELVNHLRKVCLDAGKDYDVEGLRSIASRADFVIRDSLNYLETVINTKGNAKMESVASVFGAISDSLIFNFFRAFKNKDYVSYVGLLYKIKTTYDFKQFLSSLVNFSIRGVYIMNGIDVEGLSSDEIASYAKLFKEFTPSDISYILSKLRKMGSGDIESNLMSFIYHEEEEEKSVVSPVGIAQNKEVTTEGDFRSKVLAKKEEVKLQRGIASVEEAMKPTSSDRMRSLFNFEKVEQ